MSGEGEEQPAVKQEAKIVALIVKDQAGSEVMFKVKPHTKLNKVIDAYCAKRNVDQRTVRFLYDGSRLLGTETVEGLGMEDNDHIDVVQEQLGGSSLL